MTCNLQIIIAVPNGELVSVSLFCKSINAVNYMENEGPPEAPKSEETSVSQHGQLTCIDSVKRIFPPRMVYVPASLHHDTGPSIFTDPGTASNS